MYSIESVQMLTADSKEDALKFFKDEFIRKDFNGHMKTYAIHPDDPEVIKKYKKTAVQALSEL